MNPNYDSEMKDYRLRKLLEEIQVLEQEFQLALEILGKASEDFTKGSQQRWAKAFNDANYLRGLLYYAHRSVDEL